MKEYIHHSESRKDSDDNSIDYWFCEYAKDAAYWPTRELAEIDTMHFNRGITIPLSHGGFYRIVDFQVEELATDQFVVFADAPFIVNSRGSGEANGSA